MIGRNWCKVGVFFFSMLVMPHLLCLQEDDVESFVKSFINYYEFGPEGRYTREYHPFLLEKTAKSLDALEQRLIDEKFALQGRMIIMGYEEYAVDQYYTNFRCSRINDEATRKNYAGWSSKLHNRFGFMTAFLFKDIAHLFTPSSKNIYQHFDSDLIPIFNDRAILFQEHAFGQALPLMQQWRERMIKRMLAGNDKKVFEELQKFWRLLYGKEFKTSKGQIAGTQDVLFSIQYANHLIRSELPLKQFFVGPDITYPIEIMAKQDAFATRHAQRFVQEFIPKLQPINDKNTVYVFCSFVDGVGKSTMLGNVKNWMRWGGQVEKFDHVDNSSSQLCDMFQFKDKVFIADLPAQISHFTYKPDGYVFVDVHTMGPDTPLIGELEAYVVKHVQEIRAQAAQHMASVKKIIAMQGFNAPALNDCDHAAAAFLKNIVLLKKEQFNQWLPFEYAGKTYLFKDTKPSEIRYLTPLNMVKSEGLKNIESEQMLFFDGLRLPLPYKSFLDDLVAKFKYNGVDNVVFVDFLSMYPRSSRENVRINYLVQQMALLEDAFDVKNSLYHEFVSGGELLHLLNQKKGFAAMQQALVLEAILRLALFDRIIESTQSDLRGIQLTSMTESLRHMCLTLQKKLGNSVENQVAQKMRSEKNKLERVYGLSKSFMNVQQFSFAKVCALSSLLEEFFTQFVERDAVNGLWCVPAIKDFSFELKTEGERAAKIMDAVDGKQVRVGFVFHPECKNELLLTPFIRSIRACWYAAVLNLLASKAQDDQHFTLHNEFFKIVPILVRMHRDTAVYSVQKQYPAYDGELKKVPRRPYAPFNLVAHKTSAYAMVSDVLYRTDWESRATHAKLFGFDCFIADEKSYFYGQTPTARLVGSYQRQRGVQTVLPAADLWEHLAKSDDWLYELEYRKKNARKNGMFTEFGSEEDSPRPTFDGNGKLFYLAAPSFIPVVRMMIRLLATIEMVLKDPAADIVVRDGNREDFKAALKLFELLMIPKYCGIVFDTDLFDDYDSVQPYPSWEYWEKMRE